MNAPVIACGPNPHESPISPERCAEHQLALLAGKFFAEHHCSASCRFYCAPATGPNARLIASLVADAERERKLRKGEFMKQSRTGRKPAQREEVDFDEVSEAIPANWCQSMPVRAGRPSTSE